ncbi:Putative kinase [Acidilobus saccharovorans 345-15]|uniref:non-specific serine/threonine protein kinase n=1 Tax=Acidilobus saccharovorans (strain DSM 16705 / JCM 18335 / VKM B-2471 / 345-15) TaxID=666510 RepID=D9Q2N0_ACIS3|nr:RIO1 family regulatory kinase/ATPase [Acidilobus saccharovorans]ADL19568.1 Putative kinase [Acidilobus saccharovorans 345-15]
MLKLFRLPIKAEAVLPTLTLNDRIRAIDDVSRELLISIYRMHRKFSFVPISVIEAVSKVPHELTVKALSGLTDSGLLRSKIVSGEHAYQLTFAGLDVLSVVRLIRRGVIERVGDKVGVGKESDVYLAWTPSGSPVSLKFHKEGARSFRTLAKKRSYGRVLERAQWIDVAIESAGRELRALVMVSRMGGLVPKPITSELHCVVTEYLDGTELISYRALSREQALKVLDDVINTVTIAFKEVGIVHGDLSPYNIMVVQKNDDINGYIIDWPQYIDASDPRAREALMEDLRRLASYFNKSFGLELSAEDLIRRVVGNG